MHHHHHHHSHHHGHVHHHDIQRENNRKGLLIALSITLGIMLLEFFGGIFTNSLALLSDSGHMLSDSSSLLLSLVAFWFANKPASANKTFGYYRFEILAALFNGITLFLIAGWIIVEAYERLLQPQNVSSLSMMIIAAIGLVSNLLSAWVLMRKGDVKGNINLRSAYLHILGDALGSVGAIFAGLLMYFFQWYIADPIISVIVALLILKSAWSVVNHATHILMEGSPFTIDKKQVEEVLTNIPGVIQIHDLHIWTITSGLDSLSCHLVIQDAKDSQRILRESIQKIEEHFKIQHTTLQIETEDFQHVDCQILHRH
ncbi:cation diffusion facilitator family transporter [Thermoflavimicrobium dichotomicum]|uniref:Cobalt-zinc-cadmium efflux system protein n=1 Tax=Thermoflavimicrobium dichotomicum TaxID=46223 RepID=A0A1I3RMQ1_9BACL|nr:cation diffusion facilitator family transporter [Thermoflavimicrobium dichotomicum]SFJ47142.1 cobalt-zinc-cadmium efflux system protein [Thermoflavimicrobium dichotomicum]